eukprot:4939864-Alexandrium_andersonii.AAC.1
MSASLVGSEMCIRDRPWSPPSRRPRHPPARWPASRSTAPSSPGRAPAPPPRSRCGRGPSSRGPPSRSGTSSPVDREHEHDGDAALGVSPLREVALHDLPRPRQ